MNRENDISRSYQNYLLQDLSGQPVLKKKRKIKSQMEGRFYKCQQCSKSYLSYSALYTHSKSKHDLYPIISDKGRGRPKNNAPRNISYFNIFQFTFKILYNPYTLEYLKHPDKIGETRAADSIRLMICVFEDLFVKQSIDKLLPFLYNLSDKP